MRILAQSLLIASLIPIAVGFKTNRTSCFHYVSCLEATEANLKQCAGGTAISLTLEAKDVNIRDLVKYRALEFVGCQDRLLKEIVDFEALQILVNEDARECFEKLPESSKRVEQFTDSCDYVQPVSRNSSKGDALQCLIEFKQDREYCESLLECCPDHTRCGERMNAVSLSYQNARVKAEQIVYSMISCIVVNDPRFLREGARLQSLRDPYRNAGVPFLRPDAYTEARITRRLALTSTSTLSQRRERFLKKYSQIRQVVTQNLFGQQQNAVKLNQPVEDLVTETSSKLAAETVEEVVSTTTAAPEEEETTTVEVTTTPESTEAPESNETTEVTETPELEVTTESSEMHVNTIRNLIRSASDKDLTKYVSLISEGKFSELFELAQKKKVNLRTSKFDEKLSAKMSKLKDLINEALSEKEKSSEIEKPEEKVEKPEKSELVAMEDKDSAAVFTISDDLEKKNTLTEAKLAHTIVRKNVAEAESKNAAETKDKEEKETKEPKVESKKAELEKTEDVKAVSDEKKPGKLPMKIEKLEKEVDTKSENQELKKVMDDEKRALLVESEIKNTADETKHILETLKSEETTVAVAEELPALEKEDSAEKKEEVTTTAVPEEATTAEVEKKESEDKTEKTEEKKTEEKKTEEKKDEKKDAEKKETKPELLNTEEVLTVTKPETEVEGSGDEEEEDATKPSVSEPISLLQSSKVSDVVIENVKKIRPRTEQTHCQQYASCWQTVLDYEQQCDRKYSTEVLSHGIDDSEILNILHNSSISHHEIVLKACLRPLDRSVHSTLKQLLVIQRGVRKACLELGRNKIAVTDSEEALCNTEVPTTASIDEFISSEHARSQANHLTCRAKLEPIREACGIVRNCCASVDTCDNYISSSPVKKLETEAIRRLVKKQNDCETKMLQTLSYIHEQLSNPSRRRRFYYH